MKRRRRFRLGVREAKWEREEIIRTVVRRVGEENLSGEGFTIRKG